MAIYLILFVALIIILLMYKKKNKINDLTFKAIYNNTPHVNNAEADCIEPDVSTGEIPRVVFQTYHKDVPDKVYENIKTFAQGYEHIIFNDEECISFLRNNYGERYACRFMNIKGGAHKADFFRYCYMYVKGGVYLDIKTELISPIENIFTGDYTYTCLTTGTDKIYQGIIASPPGNKIFLKLIDFIMDLTNIYYYHLLITHFYYELEQELGRPVTVGENENYYILEEDVSKTNFDNCNGEKDFRGVCSVIKDQGQIVINTRHMDFPWN